jgi:A/G-specific adenine glycosylase
MAQQTQMARVLPKFAEFMEAFPTVEDLAAAATGEVLRLWAPLGYNLRAVRLHRAAQEIVDRGGFPRTAAELERIDGIGPFTAAIVASFAFDEPVAAVDTNVSRIVRRLAGDSDGMLDVRQAASTLVAARAPGRWNQAMMDLGALVCTARAPGCAVCPVSRWCHARPGMATNGSSRVAEQRAPYRAEAPFRGSRRYYRGRIVQALRELPAGETMAADRLLDQVRSAEPAGGGGGLDKPSLRELLEVLQDDGLVRVDGRGQVGLP